MSTFFSRALSVAVFAAVIFVSSAPALEAATKRSSRVVFEEAMSVDDLAAAYATASAGGEKLRILIMPGHEPEYGGAEFKGFYEREFAVDIAEKVASELRADPSFEVFVARGNAGWNDDLTHYFDTQGRKIERFVEDHKEAMEKLEDRGRIDEAEEQAEHNAAPDDVALRLYGITKWANENDIDLVLHLHLNDEMSHGANEAGVYSGSAIYVPDAIYGNAKASKALAEPILERLLTTNATSTFGVEQEGIIEDRELIAIGAYNTSEMPSLLIEYGYIYEPRITDGARDQVFADYAYQTALGVKDFFGSPGRPQYATRALPYQFSTDILSTTTASTTPDTRALYALQASLHELGFYPGSESSLAVCPISGLDNVCVTPAVKAFQASKGFEQTGSLGPKTRAALNSAFGLSTPLASVPTIVPAAPAVPATTPSIVAPAPSCAAFAADLEEGATDATTDGEVTRLQTLLAKDAAVYPEAAVTGYFGPATLAAVKRFQVKQAVTTTSSAAYGLVGPATKAALLAACTESGA
jgi:peptidoglycan hydrolase-like protein with peptidoglycan-binding domain/N-acetylmuramoyl-L-alanine amidase